MNTPEPPRSLLRRPVPIEGQAAPPAELPTVDEVFAEKQSSDPNPIPPSIVVHAVVQVFNPTSPYYGVLFQVGDMQQGKAHGFHMMSGGRREYVTVGIDECWPIGMSKTRSRNPVSPQWEQEHKKA